MDDLFSKGSGGGSTMTWDQFASSISSKLSGGNFNQEQIIEMFKVFDKDGDGHVSHIFIVKVVQIKVSTNN